MKIKSLIISAFSAAVLSIQMNALAKPINLYNEPNDKAKVVGAIDPSKGMVPIFNSADKKWLKVGN